MMVHALSQGFTMQRRRVCYRMMERLVRVDSHDGDCFFTGSMTITYTAASITELTDGQSWFIETFVKLEKPQSCCGLPFMQLCLLFTCAVHFIKLDGLANVQLSGMATV
jgi:hypothetical protein